MRGSSFMENHEICTTESFIKEIKERFESVEASKLDDLGKPNHESPSYYYSEEGTEENDEVMLKDTQEFHEARNE